MGGRHDMGLPAWGFTPRGADASPALPGLGYPAFLPTPTRGSPLGTSPEEAAAPPRLCKDRAPIAALKPWVHAHPTARCSWGSRLHGLHPQQQRSGLLLLPTAHPARWPGSRAWSRRSRRCDEGRVKVGIPSASSPGGSGAGAAALQHGTPSGAVGVPGGSRDPLCRPVPSSEPRREPGDLWLPAAPQAR